MEVTAKYRAIIDYDADRRSTVIINKGETGEISEKLAEIHRDAWADDLDQLDHDGDGQAGGSNAPEHSDDLAALRKHYKEVIGKNPFPGWDADELRRRIDAATAADEDGEGEGGDEGDGDGEGDDDDANGPPA